MSLTYMSYYTSSWVLSNDKDLTDTQCGANITLLSIYARYIPYIAFTAD